MRTDSSQAGPLPAGNMMRLFRRFVPFFHPWRKFGIFAIVLLFLGVLFQLPLPLISRYMIDDIFPNGDIALLNWLVAGFGALLLFKLIAALLSAYCLTMFKQRVLLDVQMRLFEHVERLGLEHHDNTKTGYLMSRIGNDPQNLNGLLTETLFNLIRSVFVFVVGASILFYLHWRLALAALCLLPVFVASVHLFSARVRNMSIGVQENIGRVYDFMGESLSGVCTTKSFGAERAQAQILEDRYTESYKSGFRLAMLSTIYTSITALISGIGPLVVLAYGGREVINGNLTLGSFVAFNGYVGYLFGPVRTLMGLNASVQTSMGSLHRVFEVFDMPAEDDAIPQDPVELPAVNGRVTFEDVVFAYNGKRNAVDHVSFDIAPGERVALVGRSGAGKSTIVNLIMKFYIPIRGAVKIDGVDTKNVRAGDVRKHIGIVLQDPFLFGSSIADNFRLAKPDADSRSMEDAARTAHAHDFIMKLENGYESAIGERGVTLSGGERKRIAIAQAMLKDPRILILDEATSEVDSEAERHIQEALGLLLEGKTTFIIAHRLSTIRSVDKILLIDAGKMVGAGTHDELYSSSLLYRKLYNEQFADEDVIAFGEAN
jgi:subfamily B ATP-binding cassette protein MsbA